MPVFASPANLFIFLRYITLHVAFALLISKAFNAVGIMEFPIEPSSVSFWALIIIVSLIYARAMLEIVPSFELPSIAHLFRQVPRHQGFDYVLQELGGLVQNHYPNAFEFQQSPLRMWALTVFKIIYKFTGDVISGSLASAILITFLVHPHLLPFVFLIWAIFVLIYLYNNGTEQYAEQL